MSDTTVAEIRDALGAALQAIPGVTIYPRAKANMATPCATIVRTGTSYHEVAQGAVRWTFRVTFYVAMTADTSAQEKLDRYVDVAGDLSARAALEADQTLGGKAEDVTVLEAGSDQVYERTAGEVASQYLGFELTVQVDAPAY